MDGSGRADGPGSGCEREGCHRPVWDDSGACFWHAEVDGKTPGSRRGQSKPARMSTYVEKAYLRDSDFTGIDLHGAVLADADLRGATFAGGSLRCVDLTGADLTGANLTEATLAHADLTGADLTRADLTDADAGYASLDGATLTDAVLTAVDLTGVDLTGADLRRVALSAGSLVGADLTGVNLADADLRDVALRRATLTGADLTDADLTDADLHRAVLDEFPDSATLGYGWRSPHANLGEQFHPTPYTPHTYWEVPKGETEAYFYYFTSTEYREPESKYRLLDETLLKYGAYADRRAVVTVDRSGVPNPLWDALLHELGISDWPALVVSGQRLGFESITMTDTSFDVPSGVEFAKLEDGVLSDRLLDDSDKLKHFLNDLHSAAKRDDISHAIQKEKIREALTIAVEKLEEAVVVNPT